MNRIKHPLYQTLSATVLIVALFAHISQAQTLLPARQVSVSTNSFTNLSPAVATAQSTFEAIDQSLTGLSATVTSNANTLIAITNLILPQVVSNTANIATNAAGIAALESNLLLRLPGTNVLGASYNPTTLVWSISSQTAGVLPGTNIENATYSTSSLAWRVAETQHVSAVYNAQSENLSQVVTNGATPLVKIPFTNVTAQSVTNWSLDKTTFTIPAAGYWLVSVQCNFGLTSAIQTNARSQLYVNIDGSNGFAVDRVAGDLVTSDVHTFSMSQWFNAGSEIYFYRTFDGGVLTTSTYSRASFVYLAPTYHSPAVAVPWP